MVAALSTLGCAPTNMTYANSAAKEPITLARTPNLCSAKKTAPDTIAQFAPETATRWVSEVSFIAKSNDSEARLESPIAKPRVRASASGFRPISACLEASRNCTKGQTANSERDPEGNPWLSTGPFVESRTVSSDSIEINISDRRAISGLAGFNQKIADR